MESFKWFLGYFNKFQDKYILGACASVIKIGLALVNPYVLGIIVKDVFTDGKTEALPMLLLVMIGTTFLKTLVRYFQVVMYENVSQSIIYNFRQDIYKRIQDQSFSFYDTNKVGDIMSRMTGDLEAVRHFLAGVIYLIFENILIFVGALALILSINWKITLFMVVLAPFTAILTLKQAKAIKPAFSAIREQFSKLNSVCQENISGNRIVKAFTREDYEEEKFTKENQAYYQANVDSFNVWIKYLPLQDFLAGVYAVIMILVGGLMVIRGTMPLYQLVMINGYLWAINDPMRTMGWLINDVQRFVASLDKIFDMMRKKIRIQDPEQPYKSEKIKGLVEFKNVNFGYDPFNKNKLALKNISFRAEPGYTVGIVGPTGSGKTALVNLIARYYDVLDGSVTIDGKDVREYKLSSLRKYITYAMQDVFLFSDTVEGNIVYGVPEAPMETVISSATIADADGFVRKMSEGYDTIVGERGVGLSGGQKQRLSLARAIAPDPSILILDDTTSAVDMETEHEIQAALKEHYSDRTKFIIAHRISSVKPADLILVIVDGEIIEQGTHEELVALEGYYYGLFVSQYGEYKEYAGMEG